MENTSQSKGKGLIFFLLTSHNLFAMIPYMACAAVLTDVVADLAIPASMTAFVITTITIVSGVCMFVGSYLIDWLGYVKGFNVAVALEAAGTAISAAAPNFAVFLLGRVVFAVGFGLNASIGGALASMWFPGAQYTAYNTAYMILSCVGGAAAYIIIGPIIGLVGSWQSAYWVFAVMMAVYMVVCFAAIRYPAGVKEGLAQQKAAIKSGAMPKPEFPLKRALKRRNFILLTVATVFVTVSNSLYQTYLPTALMQENGMSATAATSITGVGIFAGMLGALVAGVLVGKTGRRKIFNTIGTIIFVAAGVLTVLSKDFSVVLLMYIALNVGYYLRMPAMSQYYLEEVVPYDPAIIAPAVAMVNGIPMLLNLVSSFIASPMTVSAGYGKTLIIFQLLGVISVVCCFLMTECGPRAQMKKSAE